MGISFETEKEEDGENKSDDNTEEEGFSTGELEFEVGGLLVVRKSGP
jgi:hypothetical protein